MYNNIEWIRQILLHDHSVLILLQGYTTTLLFPNYDNTNTNNYKDNLNLLDQRDYQMVVMIVSLLQEHLIIRVIMMKKMVDLTQPERE